MNVIFESMFFIAAYLKILGFINSPWNLIFIPIVWEILYEIIGDIFVALIQAYSGEDGTYYFEYADASDEFYIFLGSFVDPVSVVVRMDVNQGNRTYYVSLTNGELGFENIESNSIDINSITNYSEINKIPRYGINSVTGYIFLVKTIQRIRYQDLHLQ